MANPNIIGGGRMARMETSGDRRNLSDGVRPKKDILFRLWNYLGKYRLFLLLALFLVLSSSGLSLLGPRLSGEAIDAIGSTAGKVDFHTVFYKAGAMIVCYLLSGILTYLLALVMNQISRKVITKMRKDVFDRLTRLPVGFFDQYQAGDIISVLSYDINTVNQSLTNDFLQIVKSVVIVFVSLGMMLTIAPVLLLVFVVTIPVTVWFTRFLTRKVRPLFRRRSAALGELNGYVEEMIGGQKTTRAYGREAQVVTQFDKKNEKAVQAYTKSESLGTLTGPSVNFLNNASLALVSIFGALLYLGGGISLGGLASFVQYSRKFSGPINEVANIIGELQSAFAAAERVFRLIDESPETEDAADAKELTDVQGDVVLKHVDFGYTPDRMILKNLSLHAEPGSVVAIVGPTGAGKTTIINLLMRFYDANKGTVYIDGKDIQTLTRDSLRRAFTMVLQETWLFQGTIFENISYGKPDATQEEVIAAAKAARIHNYIQQLPEGYNTVLTDNGTNISKGQKQLLTIARAMLLEAKILILDEATSNVDTQTERQIQDAMLTLMKGRTCFVIAHRLSTIRNADQILVMNNGTIAENGTHDQLLAQNGIYAKLYNAQFETT